MIRVIVNGQPHFIQMMHVIRMYGNFQPATPQHGNAVLHLVDGTELVLDISFEEFQETYLQVPRQQSSILVPQPQTPFGL